MSDEPIDVDSPSYLANEVESAARFVSQYLDRAFLRTDDLMTLVKQDAACVTTRDVQRIADALSQARENLRNVRKLFLPPLVERLEREAAEARTQ